MQTESLSQSVLAACAAGEIRVDVVEEQTLPPLAEGMDCYPAVTIRVRAGDLEVDVEGWKFTRWVLDGTWAIESDDNDGSYYGRPVVTLTPGGDGVSWLSFVSATTAGGTVHFPLPGLRVDEEALVHNAISDAVAQEYDAWTPSEDDDDEIYATLVKQRRFAEPAHAAEVAVEWCGQRVAVGVFAGKQAGKPVYAVAGDDEMAVYENPRHALRCARTVLIDLLERLTGEAEAVAVEKLVKDLETAALES